MSGEYNLISGPFDIFKQKHLLLSHNNTSINGINEIIEVTYVAGSSLLPSPGIRVAMNVVPNVPIILNIEGQLLLGDKAFVYCESRNKPKNDQNGRVIPRSYFFVGDKRLNANESKDGDSGVFKIKFVSEFAKIYLGVLFFNKDLNYHFILKNLSLQVVGVNKDLSIRNADLRINKEGIYGINEINNRVDGVDGVDGVDRVIDKNYVDFGAVLGVLERCRVVRDQHFHCAVIVEPRMDPLLIKIIDHFIAVLPTQLWNFVVYCGNLNVSMLRGIYSNNSRVKLIHLPINNLTRESYSRLLLYAEFYMSIPSEHFLIFQMDTCLNQKSVGFLEKLLTYDYVGAPWKKKIKSLTEPTTINRVGNGGLSLRKKSTMIKVCQMIERTPKYHYLWRHHEDQVICSVLHSRLISGMIRIPDVDIAKKFAVESIFYPEPVGIHQAWRWLNPADYATLRGHIPAIDQLFKGIN